MLNKSFDFSTYCPRGFLKICMWIHHRMAVPIPGPTDSWFTRYIENFGQKVVKSDISEISEIQNFVNNYWCSRPYGYSFPVKNVKKTSKIDEK